MTYRVVRDGQDALTKPALDYLTGLGIPATSIRRIELDSPVGDVQTVRVTLMVNTVEPKPVGFGAG